GFIGADGAAGHVIEYAGSAIRALSMEGRLTVCNMSIEAGARAGMIAPVDTTFSWIEGRTYAPKGALFDRAVAYWRTLPSVPDAAFD
ncbi:aconitase family protein, partial [Burkholderia sp. SIMBA_057]